MSTNNKNRLPKLLFAVILSTSSLPAFADSFPASGGNIEITPLIHSSVQLEYAGTVVHIDPWGRAGLNSAKPADLILITDNPGHHLDTAAIAQVRSAETRIVTAANGKAQIPDAMVLDNGEVTRLAGVTVEAVAAYDIIPGAPAHPKGEANGYVVSLGGKQLYFAGVTECVDEVKALKGIDVAFLPMNVPLGRMTPQAAADCARLLDPDVVYSYHYDQDYARRAVTPDYAGAELPGGISVDESLDLFEAALEGSGIEVRRGDWYPPLN